ncbi:MAG: DsrE family protein [Gammaproteobacteria bacterium]|nr:DsrE family protein [Gammaproteobacteria bacterium]
MKFAILIQIKPEHPSGGMVYRFIEAALKKNHAVEVFFYEEGVYHVQTICWQDLAKKYALVWKVCSGSLKRRGIWFSNPPSGFMLSGLAHFMECLTHADRVLTFTP